MRRLLTPILVAVLLVIATIAAVSAQDTYTPILVDTACPFDTYESDRIVCGTLTVPQDRSNPRGLQVTIPYAVLRAVNLPFIDPVIYLGGGPGGSTIERYGSDFEETFGDYAYDRDVILFDYRGVGLSTPSLDCEELDALPRGVQDNDKAYQNYTDALETCRLRLLDSGVDFDLYDSATQAIDIADLWTALGYEQVNLLGLSYGSRMALTLMRDHPEGIRSAVLDGVVPLQSLRLDEEDSRYTDSLEVLFDACAKEPACRAAYPRLDGVTYKLMEQLDESPIPFTVSPSNADAYDVELSGVALWSVLFDAMYSAWRVARLPRVLDEASRGDYTLLQYELNSTGYQVDYADGLRMAQVCNDELSVEDEAQDAGTLIDLVEDVLGTANALLEECLKWSSAPSAVDENQPVRSDIPALVITGQFDPVTPPLYSEIAARTLTNSFVYTFPGLAHTVSLDDHDCPRDIVSQFLYDPTIAPYDGCIDDMSLTFDVPLTSVSLVPFEQDYMTGIRPEGWFEIDEYAFSSSAGEINAFLYRFDNSGTNDYLRLLQEHYALDLTRGRVETLARGNYTWTVYHYPARRYYASVSIAVAPLFDTWEVFIIIASATAAEQKIMYNHVLLPALDAFQLEG